MSSSLPLSYLSYLEYFKLLDYSSVIIITTVVYDYILAFPREIDYVWCRRWTRISTLYILARYMGLFLAINNALNFTTFAPGPLKMYGHLEGMALLLVPIWVTPAFLAISELAMILRVYAMWNQSRLILGILLLAYIPQIALAFVSAAIFNKASFMTLATPCMPYCVYDLGPSSLRLIDLFSSIPRSVVGGLLLVLAVSQTLRRSIEMYKVTKQWQLDKCMKLFVKDGMLFFVLSMLTYTAFAPSNPSVNALSTSTIVLRSLSYLYYGPFIPHLILGVRELYDQEARGRSQEIDTGFGVLSHPTSGGSMVVSTIVFADATPLQVLGMEEEEELIEDDAHYA